MANRGGALIKKWGRSSAASTAVSIADHLRSLYVPTPAGDCFSTAVYAKGNPYGVDGGCAAPRGCQGGLLLAGHRLHVPLRLRCCRLWRRSPHLHCTLLLSRILEPLLLLTCLPAAPPLPCRPAEDLIFSMPCRSNGDGDYEIIGALVAGATAQKVQRSGRRLRACSCAARWLRWCTVAAVRPAGTAGATSAPPVHGFCCHMQPLWLACLPHPVHLPH